MLHPFKILIALGTLVISCTTFAETISFRSDYWCPYVCDPQSDKPGYMVEIVKHVFEKRGHTVDIKLTNWVDAIKQTRANKTQALLGCNISDAPDFIYHKKPVGVFRNAYFTKKDSTWIYKGTRSLENKRIGIIKGYSYGYAIDQLIKSRHKSFIVFSGDHPLKKITAALDKGELDAFIENPVALHYGMADIKGPIESLRVASWIESEDPFLYVGFSPNNKNSKKYARLLNQGIDELRRSGELQKILEKYSLEDWEKKSQIYLGSLDDFRPSLLKGALDAVDVIDTGSL